MRKRKSIAKRLALVSDIEGGIEISTDPSPRRNRPRRKSCRVRCPPHSPRARATACGNHSFHQGTGQFDWNAFIRPARQRQHFTVKMSKGAPDSPGLSGRLSPIRALVRQLPVDDEVLHRRPGFRLLRQFVDFGGPNCGGKIGLRGILTLGECRARRAAPQKMSRRRTSLESCRQKTC